MSFIVEASFEDNPIQYEFNERVTVDFVKNRLFKASKLDPNEKFHYVLQLADTNEYLFIEFLKFLSTNALKERAAKRLPIFVNLVPRDNVYSTKKKNITKVHKKPAPSVPKLIKNNSSNEKLTNAIGVASSCGFPRKLTPRNKETHIRLGPQRLRNKSISSNSKQNRQRLFSKDISTDMLIVSKTHSLPPVEVTFENNWADEEKSLLIVPKEFGFHTEVGDQGLPIEKFNAELFNIEIPEQVNLFEKYFVNKEHSNFIGTLVSNEPVIISITHNKANGICRGLLRTKKKTHHICIETKFSSFLRGKKLLRSIIRKSSLNIQYKSLMKAKSKTVISDLSRFDESHIVKKFKFGILYCKEGQTTEDEWFGNEHGSPEFHEFLDLLGTKIKLNGWNKFRAGLDTRADSTGTHSIYTTYKENEIMFHVSTLLPYSDADIQKIERKRHLGNDIVVIVFMDGKTMFPASSCKSYFNHVYIVIQKENEEYYRIGVTIKDGVRDFGPSFPFPPRIHKSLLREFLIVKMLNAEWATYRSSEFAHKYTRTRKQQLEALIKGN